MEFSNVRELLDQYVNVSIILSDTTAFGVVKELLNEGVTFFDSSEEEVHDLLFDYDLILLEKFYNSEQGEVYFVQEMIYEGYENHVNVENNTVFIEEDVVDKIDLSRIEAEDISIIEEYDYDFNEKIKDIVFGTNHTKQPKITIK